MTTCATCTAEDDLAPVPGDDDPGKVYCPPCGRHRTGGVRAELGNLALRLEPGEYDRIRIAAEFKAREELAAAVAAQAAEAGRLAPEFRVADHVLDFGGLLAMPDPEPLIDDVLDLDSTNWIIGQPGSFKSFVALDWACHVATGLPWQGKEVRKGPVLYVAAEGARGLRKRAAAWAKDRGLSPGGLRVLPMAPEVVVRGAYGALWRSPQWAAVIEFAREIGAVLIVLDTQARLSDGLDENDAGQMGAWVKQIDALKVATGAAVLTVHHTTKAGMVERGSGVVRGAADRTWMVRKEMLTAYLTLEKSKDSDDLGTMPLLMKVVDLGSDERGRPVSSLVVGREVLRPAAGGPGISIMEAMRQRERDSLSVERQRWIVQTLLQQDDPGRGSTRADLWRAYCDLSESLPKDSPGRMGRTVFFSVITQLLTPREDPNRPGETYQMVYLAAGGRLTLDDPSGGQSGKDRGMVERMLAADIGQSAASAPSVRELRTSLTSDFNPFRPDSAEPPPDGKVSRTRVRDTLADSR
ncbi:AAA family ATPase [Actinoplanes sp. LDG1-06]|uniref:AAA family ATPase n=1 Tax=Paractinoplanes ovalisporus TaxID=2810368 RepID=A0ABS2AK03_9ACTN|nr:AAA family ATPase [Actinoplanes ovalisporus]MBM2620169.1 AAA family ATPase [Actinoplanes ovalisporus]